MPRSDYRTLINRGRKAGLNTSELYSALAGRRPTTQDLEAGGRDGNGFATGLNAAGQQTFEPYVPGRRM
jgi:hypothetical protein